MSTMLCMLLLLLVFLVTINCDDHDSWCPAVTEGCYCRKKYVTQDHIYCENLGYRNTVPRFAESETVFLELHVRYNTSIHYIQKNAFRGLRIKALYLQQLGLTSVQKEAFNGLEDSLTDLHLDANFLTVLPKDALLSLNKLEYLGIHNNLMNYLPILGATDGDFNHLTYLYLFNNRITEIPIQTFRRMPALKGLKLNNNMLTSLHRGIFDSLLQLNELELQGNQLVTLPANIFRYLNSLLKLDLSHNRIYILLTDAFIGLGKLKTLNLNNNMLSEFQSGMFRYVSNVQFLRLSYNYASSILESTFRGLRSLKIVDFSYNRISRIEPKAFKFLYRLEKLYLSGNKLISLDFLHMSFLGKLKVLDLHANNLTHLLDPRAFRSVSKLEQIDLSKNSLGNLSPGIFRHLSLLKVLKIMENPLFLIREGILNHPNLEEIDLRNCRIRHIDDRAFTSINNTKYMWLDNNEITDIPTRLFNHTNSMEILSLANNSLSHLERGMFKGLKSLKTLHLDRNKLNDIAEYSLAFLGGLTELTITHNNISELYEHSFNDLKMLKIVDLSYNRINKIGKGFTRFQYIEEIKLKGNELREINWFNFYYLSLVNLKKLDLSDCDIEMLYLDGLFSTLKNATAFKIYLSGNPLQCGGCDLSWITMIPYTSIISPTYVTCNQPDNVKGKPMLCHVQDSCINEDNIMNTTEVRNMCLQAEVNRDVQTKSTTMTTLSNVHTSTTEDSVSIPSSLHMSDMSSMESQQQETTKIVDDTTSLGTTTQNLTYSPEVTNSPLTLSDQYYYNSTPNADITEAPLAQNSYYPYTLSNSSNSTLNDTDYIEINYHPETFQDKEVPDETDPGSGEIGSSPFNYMPGIEDIPEDIEDGFIPLQHPTRTDKKSTAVTVAESLSTTAITDNAIYLALLATSGSEHTTSAASTVNDAREELINAFSGEFQKEKSSYTPPIYDISVNLQSSTPSQVEINSEQDSTENITYEYLTENKSMIFTSEDKTTTSYQTNNNYLKSSGNISKVSQQNTSHTTEFRNINESNLFENSGSGEEFQSEDLIRIFSGENEGENYINITTSQNYEILLNLQSSTPSQIEANSKQASTEDSILFQTIQQNISHEFANQFSAENTSTIFTRENKTTSHNKLNKNDIVSSGEIPDDSPKIQLDTVEFYDRYESSDVQNSGSGDMFQSEQLILFHSEQENDNSKNGKADSASGEVDEEVYTLDNHLTDERVTKILEQEVTISSVDLANVEESSNYYSHDEPALKSRISTTSYSEQSTENDYRDSLSHSILEEPADEYSNY